ncbi:inositol oxygenase 1 [Coccidioides immitis H538.4]|uniref:Inositol oxygenase n=1 Tax=Coccidioides immitis H538.4 TaxID=396776 RepID=A0A0J8RXY3_COCIT|nr:inositol oxygenase 1 [Coccidioides immitis H538.4]
MAPGVVYTVVGKPSPRELEDLCDEIDAVNAYQAKERDIYQLPQFDQDKDKSQFRRYNEARDRVKEFYLEQHTKQTVAFNLKARNEFRSKLLYFFGAEGQWDVVGDTFPVGCAFDDRIIYGSESFEKNEDYGHEIYGTKFGIYYPGIGLDNVMLSWGHDEYLYHVVKDQSTLPPEALAMIRYHSFYPWHAAGAYTELMNEHDKDMLAAVRAFNPYDLYSKSDDILNVEELKPYYLELIDEYFPQKVLDW